MRSIQNSLGASFASDESLNFRDEFCWHNHHCLATRSPGGLDFLYLFLLRLVIVVRRKLSYPFFGPAFGQLRFLHRFFLRLRSTIALFAAPSSRS